MFMNFVHAFQISFLIIAMFYILGGMSRNSCHFYNKGSKRGQDYKKSEERPKLWGCKEIIFKSLLNIYPTI
jgi:hypothetical protein